MSKNEYSFIKDTKGNVSLNLGGNSRMEMKVTSKDNSSSITAGRDVDIKVGGDFNLGSQSRKNDFRGASIGVINEGTMNSKQEGTTTNIGVAEQSNLPEANAPSVSENKTTAESKLEQIHSERVINFKVRLLTLKRIIHLRLPDSSLVQSVVEKINKDEGVDVALQLKLDDGSDKTLDHKKRLCEENVADGSILNARDIAITGATSRATGRRVLA